MAGNWSIRVSELLADSDGMSRQRTKSSSPLRKRPRLGALPDDLYLDVAIPDERPGWSSRRDEEPITITSDWSKSIPVTEEELRIFEAFFLDFVDDLLKSG